MSILLVKFFQTAVVTPFTIPQGDVKQCNRSTQQKKTILDEYDKHSPKKEINQILLRTFLEKMNSSLSAKDAACFFGLINQKKELADFKPLERRFQIEGGSWVTASWLTYQRKPLADILTALHK